MDSNSDNSLKPDSSNPEHSRRHSSGHSHYRHHRHSSRRQQSPVKEFKNVKRHRLEEEPKRIHLQKIETFFTKNILSIFGIIFIIGAIWFAIGTWKSMVNTSMLSFEKSKNVEQTLTNKVNSFTSSFLSPKTVKPVSSILDTSFIFILCFFLVLIFATLGFSIRNKNILLKTISFLTWIFVALWLFIRFFITLDPAIFYIVIIVSTIIFTLFFLSGFVDSYIGRSKWKFLSEYLLILFNSLFYFCAMMAILYKSGHKNYESVFVFLLSTMHLITVYFTDKRNITYNKVPYLIAALIITCSFLPLVIRVNPLIVFLAPLSVFLILFSKYSYNQTSVLFSLTAMLIMAGIYLFQWASLYIPDIVIRDNLQNKHLFYKGLISSIFVLPAFAINNRLLKRLAISFSQKWLSKGKYLKFIKGILLLVIYLSCYWVFNYLLAAFFKNERLNSLIWFSFNCLYFLFYIPYLSRQRSSFLRLIIILSIISTLSYFTIIHFDIIQLRNLYLETGELTIFAFLFHYIPVALLVGLLFTLLRYFKRAFPGKKTLIKSFWVYLYVMSIFLLLSEFDHIAVLFGFHSGIKIDETVNDMKKIPYSLLLVFSSMIVLIIGFVVKSRFLRLFSLFILAAILVKILVYDVSSLGPQAKMILFLFMGIILLGISVLYPKIKQSFFQKDIPQSQENISSNRKHRH